MSAIICCRICRYYFYKGKNPHVVDDCPYDDECCPNCNDGAYFHTFVYPRDITHHPASPRADAIL